MAVGEVFFFDISTKVVFFNEADTPRFELTGMGKEENTLLSMLQQGDEVVLKDEQFEYKLVITGCDISEYPNYKALLSGSRIPIV
jgi:hypothetical protein